MNRRRNLPALCLILSTLYGCSGADGEATAQSIAFTDVTVIDVGGGAAERDGEAVGVTGRQTLVFLDTQDGWKIVHEHGTVRN